MFGVDHQALNGVFELADIARPVIVADEVHHFFVKELAGPVFLVVLFQKIVGQQDNILLALPQGRNGYLDDVQAPVEVGAELLLFDELDEVLVGGGSDAHIHMLESVAPHRDITLILQHVQDFGLKRQGQLADLVQKEGTAVGVLDEPGTPLGVGAGKGPRDIAEKLAFQQVFGDRGAVDGKKGLVPAQAVPVEGLGQEALARTRFAQDQHVQVHVHSFLQLFQAGLKSLSAADNLVGEIRV